MDSLLAQFARAAETVVLTHTHADLDATGSAVALAQTLPGQVDIATPDGVSSVARPLLSDVTVVTDPALSDYELVVVVDAPSRQRVRPLDPVTVETPLVVVDHHEQGDLEQHATAAYIDTDAGATALLVAELLLASEWTLSPMAARALLAGALDDTAFGAVLTPATQGMVGTLLQRSAAGGTGLEALLDRDPPWGERVATAKALVRVRGYRAGNTLLLVSAVSGNETAAVEALLAGNADIAVVLSERRAETRVVAQTGETLEYDISLPGDVLDSLVSEFGGDGGGHTGAAVAKLPTTAVDAVETSVVTAVEAATGIQFSEMD